MKLLLAENLTDQWHFELEEQAEHRFLFGRRDDLADNRQIDRRQEKGRTVAQVGCLAEVDSFLSLHEDNQPGLVRSRSAGCGRRSAVEAHTGYAACLYSVHAYV